MAGGLLLLDRQFLGLAGVQLRGQINGAVIMQGNAHLTKIADADGIGLQFDTDLDMPI